MTAETLDPTGQPSMTGRLGWLYSARIAITAIDAAGKLGVLAELDRGPVTESDLGRAGLPPEAVRALLAALVALGLAQQDRKGSHTAAIDDLADLPRWLASADSDASCALRPGGPAVAVDQPGGSSEVYPSQVRRLAQLMRPVAARAADELAVSLPAGARVLDLGAGAAPWSLALARRDPRLQVTAVDLHAVIPVTRRAVQDAGCTDRYTFRAANIFELEPQPAGFDAILLGNLCHLFDEPTNRRLLATASRWVAPGGQLVIVDVLGDDLRNPAVTALYTLGLLGRTRTGRAHTGAEYVRWLTDVGCDPVVQVPLTDDAPLTLVAGSVTPRA